MTQGRGTSCAARGRSSTSARGIEFGGGFNNHNVEKLGITLNLRSERGQGAAARAGRDLRRRHRELRRRRAGAPGLRLRRARAISARHRLRVELRVRRSGARTRRSRRGARSCRRCAGSRSAPGCPTCRRPGWGYSYMDHIGANIMAIAILAALIHRNRTGEGQWVDMSCTEAGATLVGPDLLDYTVNGRPLRRDGEPDSNRSHAPADGAARHLPGARATTTGSPSRAVTTTTGSGMADGGRRAVGHRCALRHPRRARSRRRTSSTPASASGRARATASQSRSRSEPPACPRRRSRRPEDRIDHDPGTSEWGLWPTAHHREMGDVRVDGIPRALLRDRLGDRARRAVPRRAQRPGVLRAARPRRRRDRAARARTGSM